jgi:DNA-binding CsgD family transcriptional regulator
MNPDKTLAQDVRKIREAFPPPWSHPNERAPLFLTRAELRVLGLVAFGKTNAEIGKELFIEKDTVRTHVKRIHAKCDVKGRSRLAVAAYKIQAGGDDRESKLLYGDVKQ